MADPAITQEVEIANRESLKVSESTSQIKIRKDSDMKEATEQLVTIKKLHKNIDTKRKSITGRCARRSRRSMNYSKTLSAG